VRAKSVGGSGRSRRCRLNRPGGGRSPGRHGEGSQSPESTDGVLKLQDMKLVPKEPQFSLQCTVEVVRFFEQDRDRQLHLPYVVLVHRVSLPR